MEFKSQVKQMLPLIFLIDESGSMGSCVNILNRSINNMIESLKIQESLRAEIYVSFITFGGQAKLHTKLKPIWEVEKVKFEANGMTPLGGALKIAKDMVENREIIPSNSFRPTVILLSDGGPNDFWEENFMEFINEGRSKKCERMSLGIGDRYIYNILSEFSSDGKVFEAKDATKIIDFFKFITMTIKEKSISNNPNKTSSIIFTSIRNMEVTGDKLVKEKTDKDTSNSILEDSIFDY